MKRSRGRGALVACVGVAALGSASAQSIEAGGSRPIRTVGSDEGIVNGPWTDHGLPPLPPRAPFDIPDDPSLEFIIRDGSGGWAFVDCVSEEVGEPTVMDSEALPVGGGRTLACRTDESPLFSEHMLQGEDGQLYCWRGALAKYRTVGDARLQVQVEQAPALGPWSLRANSEQPWVMRRSAFAVGVIWPLWLEVSYQTVDFAPAVDFRCDRPQPEAGSSRRMFWWTTPTSTYGSPYDA